MIDVMQNIPGQILSLIVFMLFMMFYSRLMVTQMLFKLEKSAEMLEIMSSKAEKHVVKTIQKRPTRKMRKKVKGFLEFFAIGPINLDPYGIMKKLEHLVDLEKDRFKYFVNQIAPGLSEVKKSNIMMGLSGAMSLHQLTKVVRHFVELIKKTKSYNLALILQMQLPLIERMAKALASGTEALSNGWVIGDGVGPYIVTDLIGDSKVKEIDDETVAVRKKYKNKNLIIIKAKGPHGSTGNPGRVLEKISQREKISKIITIDAAAKLEGEKTGSVAEGVGVAMGGIGVERSHIEDFAVKRKIPLDSIIVKMSQEEAIMPMTLAILNSKPKVLRAFDEALKRTKKGGKIVVVGVGNTSGMGNTRKEAKKAEENVKKIAKKIKARKKKTKKRFKFLPF